MTIDPRRILGRFPIPGAPVDLTLERCSSGFSGGSIWRVSAADQAFALRCWPRDFPFERAIGIHGVLDEALARGLSFVPRVLKASDGNSVLKDGAHLWELTTWCAGSPLPATPKDHAGIAAALDALTQWHENVGHALPPSMASTFGTAEQCDALRYNKPLPSLGVGRRLREWRRLAPMMMRSDWRWTDPRQEVLAGRMRLALSRHQQAMEALGDWQDVPMPVSLCVRDVHREHILLEQGKVTGLIDFGSMGLETPAVDVARYLGSFSPKAVDPDRDWPPLLKRFSSALHLTMPVERLVFLLALANAAVGALHWMEWLVVQKRQFSNQDRPMQRWDELVEMLEDWPDS